MNTASEPSPVVLIPRAAQRRVRWKNDGGWTTELAMRPAGAEAFDWRISVAEVDADCIFSCFPGIDRSILVLEGAGFDLHVEGEAPASVRLGGPAHAFSGDRAARCTLVGGPTRDFNVMTRRGRALHALSTLRLRGAATLERGPDVIWVVYAAGGELTVAGTRVAAGDCALVEPAPADRSPLSLVGAAELVLVRLQTP